MLITKKQACSYVFGKQIHQNTCSLAFISFSAYSPPNIMDKGLSNYQLDTRTWCYYKTMHMPTYYRYYKLKQVFMHQFLNAS